MTDRHQKPEKWTNWNYSFQECPNLRPTKLWEWSCSSVKLLENREIRLEILILYTKIMVWDDSLSILRLVFCQFSRKNSESTWSKKIFELSRYNLLCAEIFFMTIAQVSRKSWVSFWSSRISDRYFGRFSTGFMHLRLAFCQFSRKNGESTCSHNFFELSKHNLLCAEIFCMTICHLSLKSQGWFLRGLEI